jgi:Amt family ammonium transporter
MDLRWRRLRAALAAARAHHPPIEDDAEARLDAVLRRLPALVWSTDGALRLTSLRGGAVPPLGVEGGAVVGRPLGEVLGDRGASALEAHRRARLGLEADFELAWSGRVFRGHAEPWPATGPGQGTLAVLLDTTEQHEAEARLVHAVMHDPVTGLPNRTLFLERVWQTMGRGRRHSKHGFGVLLLDLDGFAAVKDSLGHLAGDEFLSAVAGRLHPCVRPQDTLAHLGGEQFAVLVDDVFEASDLVRVAERIRRALARPVSVSGQDVFTSATIGIAPGSSAYRAPEAILRDAHTAMHRARLQGAGAFQVFDDGMHERAVARLLLETELRRAVERGEFRLHYQPIVSLQSGRLVAFEALVRWEHPRRGLLAPHEFLGLAEETGLILPVGRWVLKEGCRQMRAWRQEVHAAELPRMSLNLSGRQLAEGDLVEEVEDTLRGAGLGGHEVDLEITENVIMQDTDSTRGCLAGLRALELGVSIDDFGTGHSSLSHLDRLPVDTLKIDRSFLAGGSGRPHKAEIIRTIVALGHDLGLEVVAEGIETPAQLDELRGMGCDHGQGYLFSRPVDAGAAAAMLAA